MKIKVTTIFVTDQDKALDFYVDMLGFSKKADFGNGGYRWLTVTAPDDPDGVELQLASTANPAGKAFQEATFQQGQPAIQLFSDDVKADCERLKTRGGTLRMEPTDVTGSTIAQIDDGCGNIVQITQLNW